jgi:fatty acid-binding protein DegV
MSSNTTCLLIDASCDLPAEALAHPQLRLLPVTVQIGALRVQDKRDAQATQDFYRVNLSSPSALDAGSEPLSVDEMSQFMLDKVALEFDQVLGVFVSSTRSPIYERAQAAMDRVKTTSFTKRVRLKKMVALEQRACDSLALFSGYGVQALCLLDAITQPGQDVPFAQLLELQKEFQKQTYVYLVPGDVSYILKRAKAKGENSVGMIAGLAAKTLAITPVILGHLGQTGPIARKRGAGNARELVIELARTCLDQSLVLSKHICFSYSGNLADVQAMPSYESLVAQARLQGIQVHLGLMSMTGSVNVGPNTLCLGMLAKPHDATSLI